MSIFKIAAICTLLTSVAFADEHEGHGDRPDKSEMKKALEASLKAADSDNNGELNLQEFKAFHADMQKIKELSKPSDEQKFKEIDADGNGSITKDEMKKHRKEHKSKKNDEEKSSNEYRKDKK